MAEFVLLEHDTRADAAAEPPPGAVHWDLMLELECGAPLATWRLARNPLSTSGPIAAERIGDHRRAYLDYEGELSGGRGRVRRIDRGELVVRGAGPVEIHVELAGAALHGRFALRKHPTGWRFERDARERT
jgi:hypothetical protein